jgi:hypothetical protein
LRDVARPPIALRGGLPAKTPRRCIEHSAKDMRPQLLRADLVDTYATEMHGRLQMRSICRTNRFTRRKRMGMEAPGERRGSGSSGAPIASQLDHDSAAAAAPLDVHADVAVLARELGWDRAQLLEAIDQFAPELRAPNDGANAVEREVVFTLLSDLAQLVDTASDRRSVVLHCADMLAAIHGDTQAVRQAFEEQGSDGFAARDYIALGEISDGAAVARARLGLHEPDGHNPYSAAPTVHLSEARLRLYVERRKDVLGAKVFARMHAHITDGDCDACRGAVANLEHRGARSVPRIL